ncbi:MFS transporter [Microbacterium sp. 22242]|uniref:MFS transporter n=1 Tax=Microbacterium sp. 22242 TaxID=3453896 RepID=UPI003F835245
MSTTESRDAEGEQVAPITQQIERAYSTIGVTKAHRYIMGMVLLGVFFDAIEQNSVGITGPLIKSYWGLQTGEIGFLNTITFTATALGRVVTGFVADRFGRRTLLMINLMIFAAGSLLCALAPDYAVLAIGRFIVGYGLGGEISVAVVLVAEFFAAKHRGTAVGLVNVTAAGFGNMLAPAFGVLVFTLVPGPEGWRWVFGLLFIPALLVIYYRRYIPETPRFLASRGQVDKANDVISRLAQGKLRGSIHADAFLAKAGEVVVPAGAQRGSWMDVLRGAYRRRTILLCVAVACSYAAQISMLTLMPTILVASGYDINKSLWFTLIMQSGSLVGAIAAAVFASRWPRKRTLTIAAIVGVAAGLAMAFLSSSIVLIIVFGWLFNFAVIILNTTIWLFAPEQYPTRIRGFGASIIMAMGSLSGGLFPLITGMVFDASGLWGMFGLLAMLFVLLGIVVQFPPETFGKPLEEDDLVTVVH